jgi:hypothetical protein
MVGERAESAGGQIQLARIGIAGDQQVRRPRRTEMIIDERRILIMILL